MPSNWTERKVVITGLGVVTPLGNDLDTFWNALIESKCGVQKITVFDASNFDTKIAAEVKHAFELPEVATALRNVGGEPAPMSPDAFADFVRSTVNYWQPGERGLAIAGLTRPVEEIDSVGTEGFERAISCDPSGSGKGGRWMTHRFVPTVCKTKTSCES